MQRYDLSFDEPSMNLALDEALLAAAEAGESGPSLRFWESPGYFVVLGVSQHVSREVNIEACGADGVPITRRCSAGGCVLQGPGCLNYSLVLDMTAEPELGTIRGSYCAILTRIRDAFRARGIDAALKGTSDLAVGTLKFSGNAQRRKKRYLLHHGTVLYAMDLQKVVRYLLEPEDRPEYRGRRRHEEFIGNLELSRADIISGISDAFEAKEPQAKLSAWVDAARRKLYREKYVLDSWTNRR